MLTYQPTDLPLLPTQVIGSHGVPGWIWIVRDAVAAGKMGPYDIDEALKDATRLAILDMEQAGVDIISDGEMQRADFTWHFHGKVHGLEPQDFARKLGYPGPDQLDAFRAVAPLTVPNGYGHAEEFRFARSLTSKPLISPIQSPVTQAFRIDPGAVYKSKTEIAWALVPFINQELKEVVAAGCTHVQFDEPAYWIADGGPEEMVEIFNACVQGVEATIGFHLAPQLRRAGALLQGPACGRAAHRVRQSRYVRSRAVGAVRRRQDSLRRRDRRQGAQPGAGRCGGRSHSHVPAPLRAGQAVARARLRLQPDPALPGQREDAGDGGGGGVGAGGSCIVAGGKWQVASRKSHGSER
jgi:hypothetical protein